MLMHYPEFHAVSVEDHYMLKQTLPSSLVQDTPEEIHMSAANPSQNQTMEDLHQAQILDVNVGGIL